MEIILHTIHTGIKQVSVKTLKKNQHKNTHTVNIHITKVMHIKG